MSKHRDRPETLVPAMEQERIHTRVISIQDISDFAHNHVSMTTMILFGGDRLGCCDEGVGIMVGTQLIGIASIAPQGEDRAGSPTIVGMYVDKAFRHKQLGQRLLQATIQRCQERGFLRIHVDVMSEGMKKIINHLAPESRALLDVQDCGNVLQDI